MDEDYREQYHIWPKSAFGVGGLLTGGWMALLMFQPTLWAVVTGIAFVILSGLFTAKFILGVKTFWPAMGLAPLLGCGWLAVFYVIFWLMRE